jgi:hypothetical protein
MPFLNVLTRIAHCPGGVLEESLLLSGGHHTEQVAWLFPVIIVEAVVIMGRVPLERQWRLGKIGLIVPKAITGSSYTGISAR